MFIEGDVQVWTYLVGHGQLLLRRCAEEGYETRIDLLFKDVRVMNLPWMFQGGLTVAESDEPPEGVARELCREHQVFTLTAPSYRGFVVAGVMVSDESTLSDMTLCNLMPGYRLALAPRHPASLALSSDHDGRVVEGIITRIEEYGLYFDTAIGTALVLIPDVSDERSHLPSQFSIGERHEIRVVRRVDDFGVYKASMRDV